MPVAYSYLRFSSPQQATGDSIRRQTESSAAWCTRNKVTLDTTVRMTDAGVSAFKGKHRAAEFADTHAMAGFLSLVKTGRIPEGSYLILESLDRLKREDIIPAVNVFTSLLMAGIKIVQLHPTEHVYTLGADMTAVMLALVELSRGNSESKMKSERVGAAWRRKQTEAATKIVTKKLPGWIKEEDGKLVLDTKKAKTVRRIFEMALAGTGVRLIAEKLNEDNVPVMGRKMMKGRELKWSNTTVFYILKSRAVIGEYVPYKDSSGRSSREPVKGYFPAVVEEQTFLAVQGAIAQRAKVGGGRRSKHVNLFAGLLKTPDGGSLTYSSRKGRAPVLVPVKAMEGHGGRWTSFPADKFETAILSQLAEVKAADIVNGSTTGNAVEALAGQIAEIDGLIRQWSSKMDDAGIVDIVAAKLGELNATKRALNEQLATTQREAASPLSEAWGEFRGLVGLLVSDNSDEMRTSVRNALRRSIESVTCLFVKHGHTRLVPVRVQFRGTPQHRDYLIHYRPSAWSVRSFVADAPENFDLRNPDHADRLEKALVASDLERSGATG